MPVEALASYENASGHRSTADELTSVAGRTVPEDPLTPVFDPLLKGVCRATNSLLQLRPHRLEQVQQSLPTLPSLLGPWARPIRDARDYVRTLEA